MSDYETRPRSMADAVVEQATSSPGERRTIHVDWKKPAEYVCPVCAAVVMDADKHREWHADA